MGSTRGELVRHRLVIACAIAAAAAAVVTVVLVSRLSHESTGPQGDPAAFVSRVVALIVADDYAAAWGSLNHAHQRVAPEQEYVACERKDPVAAKLQSIRVVRVAERSLRIPGASQTVSAKAVTLRIRVVSQALGLETFDHTFNVVPEGSRWTWILTPSRYALYRNDACGV